MPGPTTPTPSYPGELPSSATGGPVTVITKQFSFGADDDEATVLAHNGRRLRARIINRGPAAVLVGLAKDAAGSALLSPTTGYLLRPRAEPFETVAHDAVAAVPLGPALLHILEETVAS